MDFKFSLVPGKGKAPLGSRARAEQDAKAREEEAARKRVLAEYLDEHGADDDDDDHRDEERTANPLRFDDRTETGVSVPQGSKRHFANRKGTLKSGPGTLDAEPPTDAFQRIAPASRHAWPDSTRTVTDSDPAHGQGGNVYTTVVATASNLPPHFDERTVESLFADYPNLKVVNVERLPPSGPTDRRASVAMRVTFHKDVRAHNLADAIKNMNDKKYLGQGYYLHLDRFLGHRAKEPAKMDFGARWVAPDTSSRFAPTAELGGSSDRHRERPEQERKVVTAYPPQDLATLKLIHYTIEGVIWGGMDFEAALMQDQRVMSDEKWAWLFDQSHPLNRYYRFRLYQLTTGDKRSEAEIYPRKGEWRGSSPFPDEFAYRLESLTPHMDEFKPDSDNDTGRRIKFADSYPGMVETGNGVMSPKARAFLMYLLATCPFENPPSKEVIGSVTYFAITNASDGLDEIVDLVITNIFEPFPLTPLNPKYRNRDRSDAKLNNDRRVATVNALRIVSDICLTANHDTGLHNVHAGGKAYKYRAAIGTQLVARRVFEYLEKLPARLGMGRMTANQFKEDVDYIIMFWRTDRLFDKEITDHLDEAFHKEQRRKEAEDELRREELRKKAMPPQRSGLRHPNPKVDGGFDGSDDTNDSENKPEFEMATTNHELQRNSQKLEADQAGQSGQSRLESSKPTQSSPSVADTRLPVAGSSINTPAASPRQTETAMDNTPMGNTRRDSDATGLPGETAAARARRLRPKAEDMFAAD